jgi:hypothetical protein
MKTCLALLAFLTLVPAAHAQKTDPWDKLQFLLGNWVGVAQEKDTPIGAGQGSYSFAAELDAKIIVRRNSSTYDSGAHHDDLMVIYADAPGSAPRAIYFDSEGHVIRYNLSFPSPNAAVFESEPAQPGPKYRLSYWLEGTSLNGKFEIAPPSSDYKTYMKWTSKKR